MVQVDSQTQRVTLSIHHDTLSQIDAMAEKLNCSRSALVSNLLSEIVPRALTLSKTIKPSSGEAYTPRRQRGASGELLRSDLSRLVAGAQADIFGGR